jgi:hypothetical protein
MSEHSTPVCVARQEEVEYREVPGWPGYRAGADGSVWSCRDRQGRTGPHWHALRGKTDRRGYRYVVLQVKGRRWYAKVARLVLEAFAGPLAAGMLVRHLDDNPRNDLLTNLAYGTGSDNADDARRNGKLCRGERHGMARLKEADVRRVRALKAAGLTYPEITARTGVKKSLASHIVTGRLWRHVL